MNPCVIQGLLCSTSTPEDIACGQLAGGAFFFTIRPCEYMNVTGDHCTKLLCLENLQFFSGEKGIPHSHNDIHLANIVSITFLFQKNDKHDATVTQLCTSMNYVQSSGCWVAMVKRIQLSYKCTSPSTTINT
jgi:hypothetical protein